MKLFQTKRDEQDDLNYEGNAVVRMMSYMKPYRGTVAFCFLLVIIITVLELYKPILIGDAIDNFITGDYAPGEMVQERFTGILWAAARYVGVPLLLFVCNRIQYVLLQSTGQKIIYEIRNELFTHVESLSMRFFDLTPVGKIVTRITNDVEALNDMYSNLLIKLFKNLIKIIGLAVVMLMLDVRMALLSFVLIPAVVILTVIFKRISRRTYQIFYPAGCKACGERSGRTCGIKGNQRTH